jgi:hypothetical protein
MPITGELLAKSTQSPSTILFNLAASETELARTFATIIPANTNPSMT